MEAREASHRASLLPHNKKKSMKKMYSKPELELHSMKIETVCIDISNQTPADPTQPAGGKERFIPEDFEEGEARPQDEDLW